MVWKKDVLLTPSSVAKSACSRPLWRAWPSFCGPGGRARRRESHTGCRGLNVFEIAPTGRRAFEPRAPLGPARPTSPPCTPATRRPPAPCLEVSDMRLQSLRARMARHPARPRAQCPGPRGEPSRRAPPPKQREAAHPSALHMTTARRGSPQRRYLRRSPGRRGVTQLAFGLPSLLEPRRRSPLGPLRATRSVARRRRSSTDMAQCLQAAGWAASVSVPVRVSSEKSAPYSPRNPGPCTQREVPSRPTSASRDASPAAPPVPSTTAVGCFRSTVEHRTGRDPAHTHSPVELLLRGSNERREERAGPPLKATRPEFGTP